jgi:excisionase family DNA binding protein
MDDKRFMDIREMSDYLGVSKWLIYKYVKNREMPFIPFGRLVRFDRLAVDKWAEKRTVRGFQSRIDGPAARREVAWTATDQIDKIAEA